MEVKPGFKQTEAGVIPEEWEISTLQAACRETITYGIVQCGPYIKNGVPYIRVSDMDAPELEVGEMLRTSPSIAAKFSRSTVEEGDLVYALRGKLGEVRQVRRQLVGANLTQGTARLSPNDRVSSDYLLWAMRSSRVMRQAEIEAKGTTFREITLADLRRLTIPVPSELEQRAIAEALSDVDALLGGASRLIAKKRDLKQAAMQQLLTGQTRLPGFHGEWEVKCLKQIVQTPITDGPHLTPCFLDDGIPFLSVNNLAENRIDLQDLRFISRKDHELFSRKCKPKKDDILLGKAASVGKVAIVELDYEFNIWSPIALIRVTGDHAPRFVYYQLQSADLIGQITLLTNSSSQGNIGMGEIEKLSLKVPRLAEQTAIAEVLTEMDTELAALEQRRQKTRDLKQGMMQELLTGKTRLI
jgi:type I restriction enzyme S subunit